MTSNQRRAMAPNAPECSFIQALIAGSRLTDPGNRKMSFIANPHHLALSARIAKIPSVITVRGITNTSITALNAGSES